MKNNNILCNKEVALQLAQQGLKLFALRPNSKKPLFGSQAFLDATSDPARISTMWDANPDANVGLSLKGSGLVAVDLDIHQDTYEPLPIELPATWTQKTGRGGLHFIFEDLDLEYSSKAWVSGRPLKNVDIKHKGYVVLAPGIVNGNPYTSSMVGQAAVPPQALLDCICKGPRQTQAVCRSSRQPVESQGRLGRSLANISFVLSELDPDMDYPAWVNVLMAIHCETDGSEEGLKIAIEWSSHGAKFKPGEIERKWHGFRADGGITFRSVELMALEARWLS